MARGRGRALIAGLLGVVLFGGGLGARAEAAPLIADIASEGPLTHIFVARDLGCQVHYREAAFFSPPDSIPADCGTLLAVGESLYAPALSPEAEKALGGTLPFVPVSQSDVGGSGAEDDPFTVVTVVEAGVVQITQTDSYVVGSEQYRTDVELWNPSGEDAAVHPFAGATPG